MTMLRDAPTRPEEASAIQAGRAALKRWRESVPRNFYTCDPNLARVLAMYRPDFPDMEPRLRDFGQAVATVIDAAATLNDRIPNHPRLERWNGIGERTEEIQFHPSYHEAGRPAYQAGLVALQEEPGHVLEQAALFYLLTQAGEMGHACPLVCTMGLVRALQTHGSPQLQAQFLPPLLERDYERKQTASQFLTEVQGGSDVGANATVATPEPGQPGVWRLNGEKWFCSVANADQMLITARPQGAPPGTKGLGLFLVPRRLPDGRLNGFFLRRLKDKFGTRTMASGEMDFQDALAYQIGEIHEGFHIAAGIVLNTSRWANALGSAGLLRRAYVEAWHFAQAREAFGHPIARYPLVQEALAEMKTDIQAMLASTLRLSHLLERQDTGQASDQERRVFRLLVNINKYWTSIQASLGIRRAQEILGGNGAIEEFSVIPRLYRDAVVFESWEGSHNVLCLQAARDMRRYGLHQDFFAYLDQLLEEAGRPSLAEQHRLVRAALARVQDRVERLLGSDATFYQSHVRRVVEELAQVTQAVCLLAEAAWEEEQGLVTEKPEVLTFFLDRYLRPGYDPLEDPGYPARLAGLVQEL